MKVKPDRLTTTLAKDSADIRLYLLFGPDESGSAELARQVVCRFAADVERVSLTGQQLRSDPALLADEAASMSLFGTPRYIDVTASGEECLAASEGLLKADNAINPVVMKVSSITEKSRIAKLAIGSPRAISCFSTFPDARQLGAAVVEMASAKGIVLDRALAERIAHDAGLDRRLAEIEVEKLALYLDASANDRKIADAQSVASLGAPSEDDNMMPVVDCVLSGKTERLEHELTRLGEYGISEIGLVLGIQRRTMQLAEFAPRAQAAGNISGYVEKEPRIFFRDRPAVARQLGCWSGPALARLNERLVDLQRRMMQNNRSSSLLLKHELAEIALAAQRMGNRREQRAR